MLNKLKLLGAGLLLALATTVAAEAKTFYWISHGASGRSGLDLFPRRRQPMGRRYRPRR